MINVTTRRYAPFTLANIRCVVDEECTGGTSEMLVFHIIGYKYIYYVYIFNVINL